MAENRVIGRDNRVPWHLPADLEHFKRLTTGHTVIMGRRTFDSIARRPLPRRRIIVLTRDSTYRPEGVEVAESLEAALSLAGEEGEVFVAGGADVYRLALPIAGRMYLTIVHAVVEGGVRFPEYDPAEWRLVFEERHDADARHRFPFTFRFYERREAKR